MADKHPSTDPAQLLRSFLSQNEATVDPNTSRSHFIDFGNKGGERHGLKYLDLKWIKLVPSGILDLHFATHHVEIRGVRLAVLYERLLREEVRKLDPIDELSQIAAIEDGSESGIAVAEPIIRELHVRQRPDGERSSPQSESGTITPAVDPEASTPSDLKM